MSRRSPLGAPVLACAVVALAGAPAHADDNGASLARDQGCLNCHHVGAQPSRQPSAQQLGDKLRRGGGGDEALRHLLDEMREHDAVPAHRRVSDTAALGVLRWMRQGGR